jgi:hypothetical protein
MIEFRKPSHSSLIALNRPPETHVEGNHYDLVLDDLYQKTNGGSADVRLSLVMNGDFASNSGAIAWHENTSLPRLCHCLQSRIAYRGPGFSERGVKS